MTFRVKATFWGVVLILLSFSSLSAQDVRLERTDWAPDVKRALNDLMDAYGNGSASYDVNTYAVFDFDNTTAIFDVEEQLIVYQLETMAFAIHPDDLKDVLLTGLSDPDAGLSSYGYMNGSYNDLFDDIVRAYSQLWGKYGPFTPQGLSDERLGVVHSDPLWLEFAAKMRMSYDLVCDVEERSVAYPWVIYWFTGMTEREVYSLTRRSCRKFGAVETSLIVWESPKEIESKVGVVRVEWTSGVSVSENMKELWKAFHANGIDVWVCSASAVHAIIAAVDEWGLHDCCKGVVAMTVMLDEEGRYCSAYDYETGFGYYSLPNGAWKKTARPVKTQTEGVGKALAIVNVIAPEYDGQGPIAGFMDSSGDFNFCTEFKSLKLAVCFNRATRQPTCGGGLIAELALFERDVLGYDLAKANAAGDVLFLLQGRDENRFRSFRPSNATLRVGESEEILLAGDANRAQLETFVREKTTVRDALNVYSLKRSAEENSFGAPSGFLDEYSGYRSR